MKKELHLRSGCWRRTLKICLLGLCCNFSSKIVAQPVALDTLFAPSPCTFCNFGFDVDVAADPGVLDDGEIRLAVLQFGPQSDQAVFVFTRDPIQEVWVREDSLGHVTPNAGNLGYVSLFPSEGGSVAMVADAGDVALWRRNQAADMWEVEAILQGIQKPGPGSANLGFASQGALLQSGEELVFIGAPNGGDDPTGGVREGSAYAFVRPAGEPPGPNAWTMEARILAPDGEQGDFFGVSVAMLPTPGLSGGDAGDALVLVGASSHPNSTSRTGVVYVLLRDGKTRTWSLETELVAHDGDAFDIFGATAAILPLPGGVPGEALALIGAGGDDDLIGNAGAAYAFRREYVAVADTFRWVEEIKLYPAGVVEGLFFGAGAIALTVDTLESGTPVVLALIGADPDEFQDDQGHPSEANLFVRSTATGSPVWIRRATYSTGAQGVESDWFGSAVAFAPSENGPLALVGAYRSNAALEQGYPSGIEAGAVFIYDSSVFVAAEPDLPVPQNGLSLSVYPNPARGEATIRLRMTEPGHIRAVLYDVLGREVAVVFDGEVVSGLLAFSIPTQRLAAGTYALQVATKWESQTALHTVLR